MTSTQIRSAAMLILLGLGCQAQANHILPPILPGDIAINLRPIATGLAAPDYAISAPGDPSRLFVVEQNGLLRVIQNGSLLGSPALDIQARVAPPLIPANANDERGFLGLAFHPGFNNPASPGYHTLYTYTSEPIPAGASPTYAAPNGAVQNYKNVVSRVEDSARRIRTWSIPTRGARSFPSARTPATTTAVRSPSDQTATSTSAWATAATPTTSARATSSRAATRRT